MSEPITSYLGLKIPTMVAGFAGATVSLAFNQKLTVLQALSAMVVGLLTANYTTDLVMLKLGISQDLHNGTAFGIGAMAMSAIPLAKMAILSFLGRWATASNQPIQGEGDAK